MEAWLRRGSEWFDRHGQSESAAACRRALRAAGRPVPRGRGETAEIPEVLRGLGVTAREMEVLKLLWEGTSTADMASRLFVSLRTVESHIARLMQRIGVNSRAQLVAQTKRLVQG